MKKIIFYAAISLLFGAILLELIRHDTGYVLIQIKNTTIEMSFWVGISLLILLFIVFWLIKKTIIYTCNSISGGVNWISDSRKHKFEKKFYEGLLHFMEGNWALARKELISSAKFSSFPVVHYLGAAHSAFNMGDTEASNELLHQAEQNSVNNELTIGIFRSRIELQEKKYDQCLTTLKEIETYNENHPVILDIKRQALWHLKNWEALINLFPKIKRIGASYDVYAFEERIYTEHFHAQCQKITLDESEKIHDYWLALPKTIKNKKNCILLYAQHLFRLKDNSAINTVLVEFIKNTLAKEWIDELVELYGKTKSTNTDKQLLMAEQWLKTHPENPVLLHALGRLCVMSTLWGKAKDYYEASLAIQKNPEIYADLADLMQAMNNEKQSQLLRAEGLNIYINNLQNKPMD